ncbi:hypothetical protein AGLY_008804 [Aphis glycines]|uniref:Uncharacterized protein n=1 Tax=Aphis glycines TaxID=307491 RepID=A0A6G0TK76_APHGL|nr:hypothetical protein AGLY_008804 [Aphis glycines]
MAGVISVPANEVAFSWKAIGRYHIPVIIRVINGEELKFVSVRMAETQLLSKYIKKLHADVFNCTSVRSHFITNSEAKLFNNINRRHADGVYGKDKFYAGKDYIVRLEDVLELYTFSKVCYNKILNKITTGRKEKCGFITINSEVVVPYCLADGHKYIPIWYFKEATECLKDGAVELKEWNFAYLKFCYKVQGLKNDELYTSESCTVTTLDVIKSYFPPETHFEEYWPAKVTDTNLLITRKSTHVNPSGVWIKAPLEVPAPESTIPHSLIASAPVMPQSMPVVTNTFQNGWPSKQRLDDIRNALSKLKKVLSKQDQQFQSTAGPSKRHRTS